MKFLIIILAIAFISYIYYLLQIKPKNQQKQEDLKQWKDVKYASDRINKDTDAENTKKASDKLGESINTTGTLTFNSKKSYGPKIDPIIEEGNRALSEMGRLHNSIADESVKEKITEIIHITYSIMQDAVDDPDDIPQIKKFFKYYLPTTIKLLNAYDRMDSKEFQGDNITNSKENINEMLDVAIKAYKKRLDSLFENQALDIETDIDVMNQMLQREGLADNKDFNMKDGTING